MMETVKIAVNPVIQEGGSLFTSEQLSKISTIVGSQSKIEMTPFRQLYIEVPKDQVESVKEELKLVGLEVISSGFVVKSLIACNFCKGAEEAGLETARKLNKAIAGIETPTPLKVGYAGCALGTSEPLLKDIGLVKMRDTFDLYVGGDPKGIKATPGRLLLTQLKEENLVPVVLKLIEFYKQEAKGKEKFGKFVNRITIEKMQEAAADF